MIDKVPRLIGIQAEGSNYLTQAWENGENILTKPPIQAHTVADSISAGLPRDRFKAMNAVVKTEGAFITVTDTEILSAVAGLAVEAGVFAEPAGAAAYAGLLKAVEQSLVSKNDRVVMINTGNGLKDIQSAKRAVGLEERLPQSIKPELSSIELLSHLNIDFVQ